MRTDSEKLRGCPHPVDAAWAAGLFEGEGCITTHGKRKHALKLTLKMCDKNVVERFYNIVGSGRMYGPYNNGGNRQDHWEWSAVCKQARDIAEWLVPLLSPRRQARFQEVLNANRS